jgi:hypothetical protein
MPRAIAVARILEILLVAADGNRSADARASDRTLDMAREATLARSGRVKHGIVDMQPKMS